MLRELICQNRSCRRFYQDHPISLKTLHELVDLARLSASAANLQPLRYLLSSDPEKNELIFQCLGWAGYLPEWPGPEPGERPSAYIIMMADTDIAQDAGFDCGIAAQSMLLGARERGLAGCMIASINRNKVRGFFDIPLKYNIPLAIAMGKPKETSTIEPVGPDGAIKYWRDAQGGHHVPKHDLRTLIWRAFGATK